MYWGVVADWRARPSAKFADVIESPFTSAVALLHAAGASDAAREAEEAKLVDLLDAAYDALGTDLPLEPNDEEQALDSQERTNVIGPSTTEHVLNYLAGVAVAWLYERRRRDAGAPVTTDRFPVAPGTARFAQWPAPTVPGYVVNRLDHVRKAVHVLPPAPGPVPDDQPIDLFSAHVATAGALPLHPTLPSPTANFLGEVHVTVRAGNRDVYTGIELQDNDEFAISATGEVRGAPLAGTSGPEGWQQLADDPGWPLHAGLDPAAHKFALLGSLGGYFVVRREFPRTRFLHGEPLPLYLRINDGAPGNGSGEFEVTIKLWGASRPIVEARDRRELCPSGAGQPAHRRYRRRPPRRLAVAVAARCGDHVHRGRSPLPGRRCHGRRGGDPRRAALPADDPKQAQDRQPRQLADVLVVRTCVGSRPLEHVLAKGELVDRIYRHRATCRDSDRRPADQQRALRRCVRQGRPRASSAKKGDAIRGFVYDVASGRLNEVTL